MGNWQTGFSCETAEHDFVEFLQRHADEPQRLYCRKCAWVRDVQNVEWCARIECRYAVPGARHEAHHA